MSIYQRATNRIDTPFRGVTVAPLSEMTRTLMGRWRSESRVEDVAARSQYAVNWPNNPMPPVRPQSPRFVRPASPSECRAVRPYWLPADAIHASCAGAWRDHPSAIRYCPAVPPPRVDRLPDGFCADCGERWSAHADGSRLIDHPAVEPATSTALGQREPPDVVDDERRRQPRDIRGRFVRDAQSEGLPPASPTDKWQLEQQARRQARDLLTHARRGTKRQLARMLGYRGRWALHTLRQVTKGAGFVPQPIRHRIEIAYSAFKRGELQCIETDRLGADGKPINTWRWPNPPRGMHVPPRGRPGRPRRRPAPSDTSRA